MAGNDFFSLLKEDLKVHSDLTTKVGFGDALKMNAQDQICLFR